MKIGIDSIAFSTSRYFFKLETLAAHRDVEFEKYSNGIGQIMMSVFPPNEDIVTIAIDAAQKAISRIADVGTIDLLIFATESSFDLSKAAGIYVHHFLKLKEECRVIEVKQACYSATAALQLAKSFVRENRDSKVLVIGSDIVKYSSGSSGEPTQGGAAVAFVVSADPHILIIEDGSGVHTNDIMDFWRPISENEALFDGKLSAYNYLKSLDISFNRYLTKTQRNISDIDCVCFHAPFGKMAKKGAQQIKWRESIDNTLLYNSVIGNSCSASLYICLMSLLDQSKTPLEGKRVGLYSYGSGSVAEYFSGIISEKYRSYITPEENQRTLESRKEISFEEYELFCKNLPDSPHKNYENTGTVRLKSIENKRRIYGEIKN
ncbi:MAG: hydroxymethylglutaryl-CoA synthase [Holosporaceae bacterium]|jgi:hydroxymethylglutaryl-CoA synthase|nr:hydroxymethylglutaryl-CoA synthase [Holosporaceae bacterium]